MARIFYVLCLTSLSLLVGACDDPSGGALSVDCRAVSEKPRYAWVQIGPGGQASARAIMGSSATCPRLVLSATDCPIMAVRAGRENLFNVTSCEAFIPEGAQNAAIVYKPAQGPDQKWVLPPHKLDPETTASVAFIGDTGCHNKLEGLSDYLNLQDCNSPESWPFATVAKSIAAQKPSLVIHVGDYAYREVSGSHDRWEVWEEDVFKPMASLMAVSPVLFVRGNHEQCKEWHRGWFHFLDPAPYSETACKPVEGQTTFVYPGQIGDPYTVDWGEFKFLVMDSSVASDTSLSPEVISVLRTQMGSLNDQANARDWKDAWLLTHRVTWGCSPVLGVRCPVAGLSLRKAWDGFKQDRLAKGSALAIQKFVAGHIHLFGMTDFQDTDPLQMIVGNSGATLNGRSIWDISDGSRTVRKSVTSNEYGFALVKPVPDSETFTVDLRDRNAKTLKQFYVTQNRSVEQ